MTSVFHTERYHPYIQGDRCTQVSFIKLPWKSINSTFIFANNHSIYFLLTITSTGNRNAINTIEKTHKMSVVLHVPKLMATWLHNQVFEEAHQL